MVSYLSNGKNIVAGNLILAVIFTFVTSLRYAQLRISSNAKYLYNVKFERFVICTALQNYINEAEKEF